ncbi:frizzled-1 [Sigmodon hispidus]
MLQSCKVLMNKFSFQRPDTLKCVKFPVQSTGVLYVGQKKSDKVEKDCSAACKPTKVYWLLYFGQEELCFSCTWIGICLVLCCASMLLKILTYLVIMLCFSYPFLAAGMKCSHEAIEANSEYFHLVAWTEPVIKSIAVLALGQVDGDDLS